MFNLKKRNTKSRKKYICWTLGILVIIVKLSIIRILEVLRILDKIALKNYLFLVCFCVPFFEVVIPKIYHWIFLFNSPELFLILGRNFSECIQNYEVAVLQKEKCQFHRSLAIPLVYLKSSFFHVDDIIYIMMLESSSRNVNVVC